MKSEAHLTSMSSQVKVKINVCTFLLKLSVQLVSGRGHADSIAGCRLPRTRQEGSDPYIFSLPHPLTHFTIY